MSRSYSRFAVVSDYSRNYTSWAKRQASKKVRRTCGIDDGGAYKKVYESWDIRDYRFFYSEKELALRQFSFSELYQLYPK
jgi:hypothetical protein